LFEHNEIKRRFYSNKRRFVVLLLFLGVLSSTIAMDTTPVEAFTETTLYLTKAITFFNAGTEIVPILCVTTEFSKDATKEKNHVVSAETATPWGTFQTGGQWRTLNVTPYFQSKAELDLAWQAFSKPGVKSSYQDSVSENILEILKQDTSYDEIMLRIPVPTNIKAGSRHDITVTVTLSDGTRVSTSGTLVAQSVCTSWVDLGRHPYSHPP